MTSLHSVIVKNGSKLNFFCMRDKLEKCSQVFKADAEKDNLIRI